MEKILNYIGGKFFDAEGGAVLENVNPALGEVYSFIPDSDERDVKLAVAAAKKAFPSWSKTPIQERARLLNAIAQEIALDLENLARIESIDNGKPFSLAKTLDIPRSEKNFEFFANLLSEFHGESFDSEPNAKSEVSYSPLGVVGCISPWNLPLYLLSWKIAPALAAGNTVVAKPSEVTPMTAFYLAKICDKVGLPPGVLNIIHGTGPKVGASLVSHPDIKAVSFTGSTASGRAIAQNTAGSFKKLALEMGGKNPNIIFADCDFDKALETTLRSSFQNQGQICLCGSRIFVEKSIYSKFRDALVEKTKTLRQGDPLDEKTQQGALVSEVHMKKVLSYLEIGRREGRVLTGGAQANMGGKFSKGYFVQPTLIEGLAFSHKLNQEEIFGPVATLIPFSNEEELIEMANSTRYGLSASLWTADAQKAQRVSNHLEAGTVWVNTWMLRDLRTPFGGVKESGLGREGGLEAFKFFSEAKTICRSL